MPGTGSQDKRWKRFRLKREWTAALALLLLLSCIIAYSVAVFDHFASVRSLWRQYDDQILREQALTDRMRQLLRPGGMMSALVESQADNHGATPESVKVHLEGVGRSIKDYRNSSELTTAEIEALDHLQAAMDAYTLEVSGPGTFSGSQISHILTEARSAVIALETGSRARRNAVAEKIGTQLDASYDVMKLGGFLLPALFVLVVAYLMTMRRFIRLNRQHEITDSRFRDFTETASDWIWEMDADLRISFISRNGATVLGLINQEVLGARRSDLIDERADPADVADHLNLLEHRKPFRDFVYPRVTEDGKTRWISVSGKPIFDEQGNFLGYRGTGREVTAVKEAENHLKLSERRLTALLESSPIGVCISHPDGTLTYANARIAQLLGYSPEEVLRKNARDFYVDSRHREIIWEIVGKEGEVRDFEVSLVKKDGETFWALVSIKPAASMMQEGGYYVWLYDLTERKLAEDEIRRSRHMLEEQAVELKRLAQESDRERLRAEAATQAKSQFIANMSHEMRTPMNAILGIAHLLDETELSSRQQEYLARIRTAVGMLTELVNDILDFSKIEAGKLTLEYAAFSMGDLLERIEQVIGVNAQAKGLEFNVFCGEGLHTIYLGDQLRLTQILINLLSNAVKFTEEGKVELRVFPLSEAGTVQTVRFSVSDTGIGIPEDRKNAIFEPFVQADGSTARRHGGTGLGLAIVSRLVSQMEGHITVETRPGAGSVFTVDIPLHFTKEPHEADKQKAQGISIGDRSALAGVHVLVADDNAINREIVGEILKSAGAKVAMATDGLDAAARVAAASGEFDLVLMDIQMPHLDGLASAKRILSENSNPPAIVAISGNALDEERARCLDAGMAGYLIKPIEPVSLLRLVARIVQDRNAGKGSAPPDRGLRTPDETALPEDAAGIGEAFNLPDEVRHTRAADVESTLMRLGITAENYARMIYDFSDRYGKSDHAIEALYCSEDNKELLSYIHALKGVSSNLCLHNIETVCKTLELDIRTSASNKDVYAHLADLHVALAELEELEGLLEKYYPGHVSAVNNDPTTGRGSISIMSDADFREWIVGTMQMVKGRRLAVKDRIASCAGEIEARHGPGFLGSLQEAVKNLKFKKVEELLAEMMPEGEGL